MPYWVGTGAWWEVFSNASRKENGAYTEMMPFPHRWAHGFNFPVLLDAHF
jgi:hypothetical protein